MTQRPFRPYPAGRANPSSYKELDATELYCPRCRQAMPVRQRLLLVLPDGDLYEYRCARCGQSVGEKMDRKADRIRLLV
ncbi:MAG: cytoplasmic protein [Thermodesulfobacteriota bacterium]